MCTNFQLQTEENSGLVVTARTMDYEEPMQSKLKLFPKKSGQPHAYLGFETWPTPNPNIISVADGMNDAGLSCAVLFLPNSTYPYKDYPKDPLTKDELLVTTMSNDILGNFAKVGPELEAYLGPDKTVYTPVPPEAPGHGPRSHFIVQDADGNTLIAEIGVSGQKPGKIVTYRSTTGVLTNFPPYPDQLDNLATYASLSVVNQPKQPDAPQEINGSGLSGMPGNASPKCRFVRVSKLRESYFRPSTVQNAVAAAGHILMDMVVPYGAVVGTKQAPNGPGDYPPERGSTENFGDYTQWMVIRDHTNQGLFFQSAFVPMLKYLDLKILFGNNVPFELDLDSGPWVNNITPVNGAASTASAS